MDVNSVDLIARERVEALKQELRQVSARVDSLAMGAIEKVKGDTKLATKVEQLQGIIESLDQIVVRGLGDHPSLRAQVASVRSQISDIREDLESVRKGIQKEQQKDTDLQVAKMNTVTKKWVAILTFIASVITAAVAWAAAYYS